MSLVLEEERVYLPRVSVDSKCVGERIDLPESVQTAATTAADVQPASGGQASLSELLLPRASSI